MARNAKAIPEGYTTVTAYLVVRDVAKAIDFYARALGAQERWRMAGPDDEAIRHAEIKVGDSIVMLGAEGGMFDAKSPLALGGTTASIYLYVENADASFEKATKAGARVQLPVKDMFWGDRCGKIVDPFGHEWSFATHQEDVKPEQMGERAKAFFASHAAAH